MITIQLAPREVNGEIVRYPEREFKTGEEVCRYFENTTQQLIIEDKKEPGGYQVVQKRKRKSKGK